MEQLQKYHIIREPTFPSNETSLQKKTCSYLQDSQWNLQHFNNLCSLSKPLCWSHEKSGLKNSKELKAQPAESKTLVTFIFTAHIEMWHMYTKVKMQSQPQNEFRMGSSNWHHLISTVQMSTAPHVPLTERMCSYYGFKSSKSLSSYAKTSSWFKQCIRIQYDTGNRILEM